MHKIQCCSKGIVRVEEKLMAMKLEEAEKLPFAVDLEQKVVAVESLHVFAQLFSFAVAKLN